MSARDRAVIVTLMLASGVVGGVLGSRLDPAPAAGGGALGPQYAQAPEDFFREAKKAEKERAKKLDALNWQDAGVRLENIHEGMGSTLRQARALAKLHREGKVSRETAERQADRLELLMALHRIANSAEGIGFSMSGIQGAIQSRP